MEGYRPSWGAHTLAAWKERTSQAWAAKEIVKTTEAAWRQESSNHAAAALHGMGLEEREEDEEPETRGEEVAAVQLRTNQKKPTSGKYSGSGKRQKNAFRDLTSSSVR